MSLTTGAYRSMCNLAAQISGCMGGHWGQDLDTFTPPFTSNKVRNVDVLWTYDRYIAPPFMKLLAQVGRVRIVITILVTSYGHNS